MVAVLDVDPGERHDDEHRGQDEQRPGDDEPAPAGADEAEVDGHLGGVGAGDEVGRAEEVEEVLLADPATPLHDLVLHHGDVRGRAAEGGDPEPEEERGHLAQAAGGLVVRGHEPVPSERSWPRLLA